MHRNIVLRSPVIASIRQRMIEHGLQRVPDADPDRLLPRGRPRLPRPVAGCTPGKFYALPQAPQQFKQLLMVSGFDRYFQIAPCFRDEDARADRSPGEFYQLDVEMSFVTQEDVFAAIEQLMTELFDEFGDGPRRHAAPFPRIPFREAMLKYGSDKPDLRTPLEIVDVTDLFAAARASRPSPARRVRARLARPGAGRGGSPRTFFDQLERQWRKASRAPGAWPGSSSSEDGTLQGPDRQVPHRGDRRRAPRACGPERRPRRLLRRRRRRGPRRQDHGRVARRGSAERAGPVEEDVFRFCWIVDFPMYEKDEETGADRLLPQPVLDAAGRAWRP